ncbi:MAG: phycobilisome linker polypeptide [Oscillatoriales cyanobacterium SM2_2_1]|nr:phycobilisome linker polypeptide [Oscillatoriales cyanobacterium SM2_2_1]
MHGQSTIGAAGNSESGRRVFRFEVVGLRQSSVTDRNAYPIRRSGSTLITVPYNKMNEEMLRIGRLGGKIVKIEPIVI